MNNIEENKNSQELSLIIRSLIKFIVLDGAKHVSKKERVVYIQKYIYTLSKCVNGQSSIIDMRKISDQIEKDIALLNLE